MINNKLVEAPHDMIYRTWLFLCFIMMYIIMAIALESQFGRDDWHLSMLMHRDDRILRLMRWVTELGDWPFGVLVLVGMGYRYGKPWVGLLLGAVLMQFFIAHGIKHLFFADSLRPIPYFSTLGWTIETLPAIDQGSYLHFPSGHSTMASAVFMVIAIACHSVLAQLICALAVMGVAISRVYLAQHFVMDTVAGVLIGIVSVTVSYYGLSAYGFFATRREEA